MPFFTRLRRASHLSLSGHCAAGAARTAKLAGRAEGRKPGVKKVTKRNATPMQRSPGILPSDFAKRFRGWLTVHPWTDSQLARIPASHPSGNSSTTSPLHRGPIHCASCAAKTKQIPERLAFALALPSPVKREKVPKADEGALALALALASALALALALCCCFGAHDARYPGPVTRGGTVKELSEGWPTGSGPVRRQSTDGLSANPGAGPRTWSTGTVRKA